MNSVEELTEKHRNEQKNAAKERQYSAQTASKAPKDSVEDRDNALRRRLEERRIREEKRKLANEAEIASPVKPLSTFMNMDKTLQESPENIGKLWTGYHISRNKLSAVIPATTYLHMVETSRKFPQFVVPLPRAMKNDRDEDELGYEMQFLQWTQLPAPKCNSPNAPSPTAVMFTPLAEYQLRQEYAQPSLVLTHYTEFIESKGIVLMRGDITDTEANKENSESRPLLTQQDAQILALCLQRFYHIDWALEGFDNDEEAEKRRTLLRAFHGKSEDFDLKKLIQLSLQV